MPLEPTAAVSGPSTAVDLPRSLCTNLGEALSREWLVTNGIGGYALGTVAGALTRRYHGLLIAATRPPAVRTVVLSKLEERLVVRGTKFDLSTNLWADGTCAPEGFRHCSRFKLERGIPTWRWELDECTIEKRIAMVLGENAVIVEYRSLPGSAPCELFLEALTTNRSHHSLMSAPLFDAPIERISGAIRLRLPSAGDGVADDLWLHCPNADASPVGTWWRNVDLPTERERGYDHRDSLLHAATFAARLMPGQRLTFGASLGLPLPRDPQLLFVAEQARRQAFIDSTGHGKADVVTKQLLLATDQCVVRRPRTTHASASQSAQDGWSVIAGYPWFADWSRDTMLSLPGLFLATRRYPAARGVLETYARHLSGGMLPNRFPDRDAGNMDTSIEYNSVDAPLLFIRAIGILDAIDPQPQWLRTMWPAVRSIIDAFARGTRYGIKVDADDGLVSAGEVGQQLTWMDAKVNGRVITPRMGKPVEINALWYQALTHAVSFAQTLGENPSVYQERRDRVRTSFERFWNPEANACFDVIDGPTGPEAPDGDDRSLRPNQVIAIGLEHTPVDAERCRAIAQKAAAHLLTPLGLRTLAPADPRYRGRYEGDVTRRDEAYHQGTVWPWLLPFFVRAWRRTGGDPSLIVSIRSAIATHLTEGGLGSISEILDAEAPHAPRGCPMQAWSVAAALEIMLDSDPCGVLREPANNDVVHAGGQR